MNVFLVVANVLGVLALVLYILCVGLPYWFYSDPGSGFNRIYYGLWELCISINNDEYVCRSYGSANVATDDWLVSVGALEVMALALMFIALMFGCFAMCCMKTSPLSYIMAFVTSLLSAVCALVGVIVFETKFSDGNNLDGSNLHASFYLALCGVIVSLVAAIFYMIAKFKSVYKELY